MLFWLSSAGVTVRWAGNAQKLLQTSWRTENLSVAAMARSYLLLLLGIGLCSIAFVHRGWTYFVGWLGLNIFILGIGHIRGSHRVFGKRTDGTLPIWSWIVLFPLHVYSLAVLKLVRSIGNEPWVSRVNEKLAIGSRPSASDDCGEFEVIIDLTAEFQEVKRVRERQGYFCFPILDASAPDVDALEAALKSWRGGRALVHCAQGHGRTGLFAAAWLLANGGATTSEEAVALLAKVRPGVKLNSIQQRCLSELERRLKGASS
jgi:protein-tyrosine phosphatase